MNVTELLITGYNGDEPVFIVSLAAGDATSIAANTADGQATVGAARKYPTQAFASILELLDAPPRTH